MTRKIIFLISIVFSLIALTAFATAVLPGAVWQNGLSTLTFVKGGSAFFNIAVISAAPPTRVDISLVDSSDSVLRNFGSFSATDGWYYSTVTVNPADYNGLGGTFYVRVAATDSSGDVDYTTLTLIVTQQAPVVSNIPDVTLNAGDSLQAFDLDNYVTDADDAVSSMRWSVAGNDTSVSVSISSSNVVTISANSGYTGTRTLTFTATDPSGASSSDAVAVTVNPAGTPLPSASDADDLTIHSLNIKVVDGNFLLIRNRGSSLDGLRVTLDLESADSEEQVFRMDLDRNTVTYKQLDFGGIESGTYLAKIGIQSSDDDFDESGYLVVDIA